MEANIVSKEKNKVTFIFKLDPEYLEEGVQYAYNRAKGSLSVPGFRKGHVPRKYVESQYGKEAFYEEASSYLAGKYYEDAVDELDLDVIAQPESIQVKEISPEFGVSFEVIVDVKPDVVLGQYKGIEVEIPSTEVTEEEILAELDKVREKNSRMIEVTDRPAQMKDTVTLAYKGAIDGVEFAGGSSPSTELTLGSHTFIDKFEEEVCGHSIGDKFQVVATFPDDYYEPSVAGKESVFDVELKAITGIEMPELNDEFAQDVSEFDTLDEYKASIKENLERGKETKRRIDKRSAIIDKVCANAQVDVPQIMIDEKVEAMFDEAKENLSRQGISIDLYYTYTKHTEESLKEEFRGPAEKNVKAKLVLEAIAKAENMEVSDEEYREKLEHLSKIYNMEAEKLEKSIGDAGRKAFTDDILIDRAFDLIEDEAIEIPAAPKAEEKAE